MLTDPPAAAVAPAGATAAPGRGRRSGEDRSPVRRAAPVLLVALLAAATAWTTRGALIDDSYITLTFARNVALHGTWGLLTDVPSATATSPPWVLLLAALTWVVRDAVLALGIAHVAVATALVPVLGALARRTGLPGWTAPAATTALLLHPLMLSAVGMETWLLVLLLASAALAGAAGRAVVFGLLAGAAFLTRMDAAVALVGLTLLSPAVLRRVHLAVPAGLAVALPWLVWSWYALGTAIPDTFVIKTQQRTFGRWSVTDGWIWYFDLYGATAVVAFAPMALAVLALALLAAPLRRRPRPDLPPDRPRTLPWLALTAAGALHWLTLVALGVPPYHWYFAPLVASGLLGTVAAAAALTARGARLAVPVAVVAGVQVLASVVVDVARPLPWRVVPVQTNFASSRVYERMGEDLRSHLEGPTGVRRVVTFGEIGHLAHVCDCVVDGFADPARVVPGIEEALDGSTGPLRRLLELNYRHRDLDAEPVPVVGHLVVSPVSEGPDGLPWWNLDLLPGGGDVSLVLDRPAPAPPAGSRPRR